MTTAPEQLVTDGIARVAKTLYPVHVTVDSNGNLAARFMLIQDGDHWVAGAWKPNTSGAEPDCMVFERVATVNQYNGKRIHLTLESGRIVTVTPSTACGCSGRLRSYNPFGANVTLASVPGPEVH